MLADVIRFPAFARNDHYCNDDKALKAGIRRLLTIPDSGREPLARNGDKVIATRSPEGEENRFIIPSNPWMLFIPLISDSPIPGMGQSFHGRSLPLGE